MRATADRLEFAPPPQPAAGRAFALAIAAHLLLLLALTWGINWKRESENVVAEAELWSSVPQQAAPKVVTAPPLPAPTPVPEPQPAPAPPPPPAPKVIAPPPPPAPVARQPDIAVEREKKRQELAQRRQEELERQKKIEARERLEELERSRKLEAQKKREAQKQELARKEQERERRAAEEQAKAKASAKARQEEAAKARQQEARLAALRKENMERMMKGLPGGAGAPTSTSTAARASGPSESYAGRVRARVRPNIVFSDDVSGNPKAEVEVRMAPDGTITSKRVMKSSGVKSWDEAVIRALDKTEVLPRDVDGRVHSPLIIEFRPKG